jgi:hypothetical protein
MRLLPLLPWPCWPVHRRAHRHVAGWRRRRVWHVRHMVALAAWIGCAATPLPWLWHALRPAWSATGSPGVAGGGGAAFAPRQATSVDAP